MSIKLKKELLGSKVNHYYVMTNDDENEDTLDIYLESSEVRALMTKEFLKIQNEYIPEGNVGLQLMFDAIGHITSPEGFKIYCASRDMYSIKAGRKRSSHLKGGAFFVMSELTGLPLSPTKEMQLASFLKIKTLDGEHYARQIYHNKSKFIQSLELDKNKAIEIKKQACVNMINQSIIYFINQDTPKEVLGDPRQYIEMKEKMGKITVLDINKLAKRLVDDKNASTISITN